MPEGHTLRRLADELTAAYAGSPVEVSSPQGRFAAEAALLTGSVLEAADSAGKHLFLDFSGDRVVHIHLGLIGGFGIGLGLSEIPPAVGQVRLRLAARQRDGSGDEADLTVERPRVGGTTHDVATRRFPGVHTAVEEVETLLAGDRELGVGLAGSAAGLADEHDGMLDVGEVAGVFAQGVERNVERAGDVHAVELGAGTHVEDADPRVLVHQLAQLRGADRVGVGKCCGVHDVSIS